MRLLIAKFGNLPQSLLAKHRKIDGCAERDQTLIGADVGSGTFTFDVLFARGEREDVRALTMCYQLFRRRDAQPSYEPYFFAS